MLRAIVLPILLSCSTAKAGLLFDPYAGYTSGNIKMAGSSSHPVVATRTLDSSGTVDGIAYGGRFALTFGRLFLGADYQGTRAKEKLKSASSSLSWNTTAIYGILGWQFYSGFRIYGGVTATPFKTIEDTSPDQTEFEGSSQKIGLGFRYHVPIAVNIEYVTYDFKNVTIAGFKDDAATTYNKLDHSAIFLGVSFPFQFGGR